jgi:hypothetical protein
MSEINQAPPVNLLEVATFKRDILCKLPTGEKNVERDFKFSATFKALPTDQWEDLIETATRAEAVKEVLLDVEGIPAGQIDGQNFTPVEVCIRNPFTCDAAFASCSLYLSSNSRKAVKDEVSRKNSRRSR